MNSRYVYLLNNFFIMLIAGTIYSYSVIRKPLEEYLKISSNESYIPFKFLLLFFSLSVFVGGYIIERYGIKKAYIIGVLLLSFSWISSYFITSIWCFVFSYGFIGGISTGIVYSVPLKIAAEWFKDKKGFATGLSVLGFGLSTLFTAQILKKLIITYGLIKSFLYFGIISFVVLFLCYYAVRLPESSGSYAKSEEGLDSYDMLKKSDFYILYFSFLFACSVSLTAVSFTATYFIDKFLMNISQASYIVSIMAVLNASGRPVYGYITDRFGYSVSLLISNLKYLIAGLIFIFFSSNKFLILFAFALLWFNLGGWLAIAPVSTIKFFGLLHYSKNYGIVYTAYGAGAFTGMSIIPYLNYKGFFMYVVFLSFLFVIYGIKRRKNEIRGT